MEWGNSAYQRPQVRPSLRIRWWEEKLRGVRSFQPSPTSRAPRPRRRSRTGEYLQQVLRSISDFILWLLHQKVGPLVIRKTGHLFELFSHEMKMVKSRPCMTPTTRVCEELDSVKRMPMMMPMGVTRPRVIMYEMIWHFLIPLLTISLPICVRNSKNQLS